MYYINTEQSEIIFVRKMRNYPGLYNIFRVTTLGNKHLWQANQDTIDKLPTTGWKRIDYRTVKKIKELYTRSK